MHNPTDRTAPPRPPSSGAAVAYERLRPQLVDAVNRVLDAHPDLPRLIGGNSPTVMYANHRNHAAFVSMVLRYRALDLLRRMLPWVYRAYGNHGFSLDYFPTALAAWRDAIRHALPPSEAAEITPVYDWMLSLHGTVCAESREPAARPSGSALQPACRDFLAALLGGNRDACRGIAARAADSPGGKMALFCDVVTPALYEIGRLWEEGTITVAQEHLASAMVGNLLAAGGPAEAPARGRGRVAVVTAAADEYHQLGAWMVADALESDGWDVRYLGAATPVEDVIAMVSDQRANLLCVSATMPFSVPHVHLLIQGVRSHPGKHHEQLRIIVGGLAFLQDEGLWRSIEADGYARDCREAVALTRTWFP